MMKSGTYDTKEMDDFIFDLLWLFNEPSVLCVSEKIEGRFHFTTTVMLFEGEKEIPEDSSAG